MRRPFGRTLIAVGDNAEAAALAGAHVWWVKTRAFMLSSLSATVAGILLVGYAGVHPSVGPGYEFTAITAVVLGGVVLGGGRGWVLSAAAGAFALRAAVHAPQLPRRRVDLARHRAGRHHHRRRRRCRRASAPGARRAPKPQPGRDDPTRPTPTHHHCPPGHRSQEKMMRMRSILTMARRWPRRPLLGPRPPAAPTSTDPTGRRPGRGAERDRRRRGGRAPTRSGSSRPSTTPSSSSAPRPSRATTPQPWLQYIDGEMTDTSEFASPRRPEGLLRQRLDLATRGARPAGSP